MGWLSGWSWAKEISLTGQAGAGTLYQVELDIGASAGGDFHCEGHCTNFPQDIEVTDNDGTTLLDFSIEDITADPIKLWVEVADDLGSNQKVWVYYGKSGATTNSNINTTFPFGDDFGDADWTDKWQDGGGSGTATESSGTLKITSSNYLAMKLLNPVSSGNYRVRTRSKVNSISSSNVAYVAIKNNTNSMSPFLQGFGGYMCYVRSGLRSLWRIDQSGNALLDSDSAAIDTGWHIREIYTTGTTPHALYDATDFSASDSTYTSFVDILLGQSSSASQTSEFDWVFVRKYNSPEPAFASAGAEQSAPTVGHPTMKRWGGIPGMQYTGRRSW